MPYPKLKTILMTGPARFYNLELQHRVNLISNDLSLEWTRAIRLFPDRDGIRWA